MGERKQAVPQGSNHGIGLETGEEAKFLVYVSMDHVSLAAFCRKQYKTNKKHLCAETQCAAILCTTFFPTAPQLLGRGTQPVPGLC